MKVTQERLAGSQLGLEIEIPADDSKQAYEKLVRDLARNANIPGFRKGKVPRQVLLQRMGTQRLKAAALEDLVQDSVQKAIEQEKIEALGNFKLRSPFEELVERYTPGEPLIISASVDVPPEVELGDYQQLSIQAEETQFDPQQVEDYLEQKREEEATLVPVEGRPAQMGDRATLDFAGREPGQEEVLEGVEQTDFELNLKEGEFIPGFVEGVSGMNPGETKELPIPFPEDYPKEELAGKTVNFTIHLKDLKVLELPELDDEFASELEDEEAESLEELRQILSDRYQEQAREKTQTSIRDALVKVLVKQAEIEVPETLVEEEIKEILTNTAMTMERMGFDVNQLFTRDNLPEMKERARPEAVTRLKQRYALDEVARREDLAATEEEIEAKMNEVAAEQGLDLDETGDRLREIVQENLRREQALEWLEAHADVELVPEGTLPAEDTPEVKLGDYQQLSVRAEEVKFDPLQVDNYLEELQENEATLVPVEGRPAQMGDLAVIDFAGQEPGGEEILEGTEETDFEIELLEGQFPGEFMGEFVPAIVGMNPGETKELPVDFPEDYSQENLAGKTVNFTLHLKELKVLEYPELNDEFVRELEDEEAESLEELRQILSDRYQEEAREGTQTNIRNALVQALVKRAEIEIPESLLEEETKEMVTDTAMALKRLGIDIDEFFAQEDVIPGMMERARPDATMRLKYRYALDEVARQEAIVPTEEEIEAKMKEVAQQEDIEINEETSDRLREMVQDDLRREQALDWLEARANIELVPEGTLEAEAAAAEEEEEMESGSALETEAIETAANDIDDSQTTATESVSSETAS